MPWTKEHIQWLHDTGEVISISTGDKVPVFEFDYDVTNEEAMSHWARHFRNHYCADDAIEMLKPQGMTNKDYLLNLKFPHKTARVLSFSRGQEIRVLINPNAPKQSVVVELFQ